jgi:hypothetical protein
MDLLSYEQLIETFVAMQAQALASIAAYTTTVHERRVDVYPCGFYVHDDAGEPLTARCVCADLAAVLVDTW